MKKIILFLDLIITTNLFAQDKFLADTMSINVNTKLIGRYPQYDKNKTYSKWNFIVEDPKEIRKITNTLILGKEVPNSFEGPDFRITIVQDNKEVKTWMVNPNLQSVSTDGHTYKFDLEKIKYLNQKYPFEYNFETIIFKSKEEYENYLEEQKKNKKFLFDYEPQFKYDGSFEIEFPRNKDYSSPKKISEYLKPLIETIVKENEYSIQYHANEKNMKNQNQFTMTVVGSKKIFDNLKLSGLKNMNWQYTTEDGMFFYRTK